MMSDLNDWINVNIFVLGVYRGTTRCHKDSLVGRLAKGDLSDWVMMGHSLKTAQAALTLTLADGDKDGE
jgi:hypothetical protein